MKQLLWISITLVLSFNCSCRRSAPALEPAAALEPDSTTTTSDSATEGGGRHHPPRRQFADFNSDSLPPPAEPDEWVKELKVYIPRSERKAAVVRDEGGFARAIEKGDVIEGLRQSAHNNPDSPFALTDEEIDALAARDELIIE